MEKNSRTYRAYVQILKEELIPAMGCTEPIAIAYAAAKAREVLEAMPDRVEIGVSSNIIKNVKSVVVPNTDGLKGIEAAAAAGIVAGQADKALEVISSVTSEQKARLRPFLAQVPMHIQPVDNSVIFDIILTVYAGPHSARVRIAQYHTNIVSIEKDGQVLVNRKASCSAGSQKLDSKKESLSVAGIIEFAKTVSPDDISAVIDRQIEYNTAIAKEGLRCKYGVSVGRTLLTHYDASDVRIRARAMAAAGSDARMSGCSLPVVINSGSGNQGLTVSLPVIEYARAYGKSHEELIRALALSNLIAIHQKRYIGPLSAFCGAVNAATGAAAGICFLLGGSDEEIRRTITDVLANVGGIVCDGAKPSCAAKISSALEAAILSYEMTKEGDCFKYGEGLVGNDIEKTIESFGRVGREGMKETDAEILKIMLEE